MKGAKKFGDFRQSDLPRKRHELSCWSDLATCPSCSRGLSTALIRLFSAPKCSHLAKPCIIFLDCKSIFVPCKPQADSSTISERAKLNLYIHRSALSHSIKCLKRYYLHKCPATATEQYGNALLNTTASTTMSSQLQTTDPSPP